MRAPKPPQLGEASLNTLDSPPSAEPQTISAPLCPTPSLLPPCSLGTGAPEKRHRGSRDTHGTHGDTRAHGSHRRTSQPSQPTPTHPPIGTRTARPRDDRIRGRLNSRSPGADRSPRSTQKRPPPANPTLPPPAPKFKKTGGSQDTHWTHGKHRSRRRTSQPTPVPTPAARLVPFVHNTPKLHYNSTCSS
jgi:hypothetical protein